MPRRYKLGARARKDGWVKGYRSWYLQVEPQALRGQDTKAWQCPWSHETEPRHRLRSEYA